MCRTCFRRCGLLAAPLAAWLILAGHDTAALLVFAAAGASDGLDGFIARRWGVTSRFGAWLDPAADKLLMLFCFIALYCRRVPRRSGCWRWWWRAIWRIAAGWLLIKLLGLQLPTRRCSSASSPPWCRCSTSSPCCCCWPSIWMRRA